MKIDWNEKPNGIAMRDLRDFMKRHIPKNDDGTTLEYVARKEQRRMVRQQRNLLFKHGHRVKYPTQDEVLAHCTQHLSALEELGYIETCCEPDWPTSTDDNTKWYCLTDLGLTFWDAKAKRFSRKVAQRQLDEFLQRCRNLNAQHPSIEQPETICQVDEVIVYGSFANQESGDVGDVDICVSISVRDRALLDQHKQQTLRKMAVQDALAHLPDILALKMLRKGLNILSVGTRLPDGATGTVVLQRE